MLEETRTDIEELYNERIAAYNVALNEKITKEKYNNLVNIIDDLDFIVKQLNKKKITYHKINSDLRLENQRLRKKYILENQ